MKKLGIIVFALFSLASLAEHYPIVDFGWGTYLGVGDFTTSQDGDGSFSALSQFQGNQWQQTIVHEERAYFYHYYFDFQEDGFFTVSVSTHIEGEDDEDQTVTYDGHGYCMTSQCHFFAALDGNFVEETLSFDDDEGMIYQIGSFHLLSEDGSYNVTRWEAALKNIDHYDE